MRSPARCCAWLPLWCSMPDDPFSGIKDKDLANFCRDLARRGYEVRRMGTDHFQAFWEGEYTHCRIPLTPRGPGAFTRCKAAIKRFERSHGMYAEPVKSERPRKPKVKAPRLGRFVMPATGDVSDRRPASIAPSQYTVATMLGSDAMMKLASAVMPERLKEVTMKNMQQRRSWTLEEKAAIVKRYRDAVKVQGGESLLKELGIYNSHITSFTQQLRQNGGWDLDATPVIREEPAFETVEVPEPVIETVPEVTGVVVTEPVFDNTGRGDHYADRAVVGTGLAEAGAGCRPGRTGCHDRPAAHPG